MKNVLYLLNHAGKAGTERYVQTLIERLHGTQINAFFAYNEDGLLAERLKDMKIPSFNIKMTSRFDFAAARRLKALCGELKIDIVHTQFLRENYTAMLAKLMGAKIKVLYTNHFILENDAVTRLSNMLLSPLQSKVIAVCNKGREQLIKNKNPAEKISVIFNAVDPDFWRTPVISTLKKEYRIEDGEFVFLCASRFAHDKGHSFLVNSARRLKELTERKFKLVLAGDGELLSEIKELSGKLGMENDIIFTGFRDDIKNLYFGSDAYVNSSSHEALSFLIIEALASGLPVIATDMGGNPDIINKDCGCGISVPYGDCGKMAEAMKRLMEDRQLLELYRDGAYRLVREKFDVGAMAEKTMAIYSSLG